MKKPEANNSADPPVFCFLGECVVPQCPLCVRVWWPQSFMHKQIASGTKQA